MRLGVALAVSIGLVIAVPAAARQQDDSVTVRVGQTVRLTTVFDKKTKYTVVMSGLVTVTAPGFKFTYDPFYGFVESCPGKDVRPAQNLQITDEHGGILDPAAAGRPACRSDHRYEFQINEGLLPDLVGRATARITSTVPTPGYTHRGSFTLQIKPTPTGPPTCVRTYVVRPFGTRIAAQVHNTELTAKQVADVLAREKLKYAGWDYTPLGKFGAQPTRKVNCAGFVMLKLFGQKMVDANVDPDRFFRLIVDPRGPPYGEQRTRLSVRAGDIAVWKRGGVAQHVAFVEAGGLRPTILTKDGNERAYRMNLALRLGNEPLTRAHGTIEFWHVNRSEIDIQVVAGKNCGT
jgi:hypothetical protein